MPQRQKQWKKSEDVDRYIRELEQVYGLQIELRITPENRPGEVYAATCTLEGYHDNEVLRDGPIVYHTTRILTWPEAAYVATMLRALTDLTYQCIEQYVQVIPKRIDGNGPAS